MLSVINNAWGWIGLEATELVASNPFGNVIVRDATGEYWRICPEELSCEVIARTSEEYEQLQNDIDFRTDWSMGAFLETATSKFGALPADRCYCLKLPAVFGGEYAAENLGTITRTELVAFAGDMAKQTKDVPDGGKIILKVKPH